MFFITRFNKNEKIIDLLNQTLFLMKVKLNKLEKYNHTKENNRTYRRKCSVMKKNYLL